MQALGYVQGWQQAPVRSLLLWTSGPLTRVTIVI
jgi:hypothetical protein